MIVHDPQPAGLIPPLKDRRGVTVIWRCHVGFDVPSEHARAAWRFLRPYVERADAYVFSRRAYEWEGLDSSRTECWVGLVLSSPAALIHGTSVV